MIHLMKKLSGRHEDTTDPKHRGYENENEKVYHICSFDHYHSVPMCKIYLLPRNNKKTSQA